MAIRGGAHSCTALGVAIANHARNRHALEGVAVFIERRTPRFANRYPSENLALP